MKKESKRRLRKETIRGERNSEYSDDNGDNEEIVEAPVREWVQVCRQSRVPSNKWLSINKACDPRKDAAPCGTPTRVDILFPG